MVLNLMYNTTHTHTHTPLVKNKGLTFASEFCRPVLLNNINSVSEHRLPKHENKWDTGTTTVSSLEFQFSSLGRPGCLYMEFGVLNCGKVTKLHLRSGVPFLTFEVSRFEVWLNSLNLMNSLFLPFTHIFTMYAMPIPILIFYINEGLNSKASICLSPIAVNSSSIYLLNWYRISIYYNWGNIYFNL